MQEIQAMLNKMFGEVHRNLMSIEASDAKANPSAHKLSTVFEGGSNYKYYERKKRGGRVVRWCYSSNRNVAGYYLSWREVVAKNGSGKRDRFMASKTRQRMIERCRRNLRSEK